MLNLCFRLSFLRMMKNYFFLLSFSHIESKVLLPTEIFGLAGSACWDLWSRRLCLLPSEIYLGKKWHIQVDQECHFWFFRDLKIPAYRKENNLCRFMCENVIQEIEMKDYFFFRFTLSLYSIIFGGKATKWLFPLIIKNLFLQSKSKKWTNFQQ